MMGFLDVLGLHHGLRTPAFSIESSTFAVAHTQTYLQNFSVAVSSPLCVN